MAVGENEQALIGKTGFTYGLARKNEDGVVADDDVALLPRAPGATAEGRLHVHVQPPGLDDQTAVQVAASRRLHAEYIAGERCGRVRAE